MSGVGEALFAWVNNVTTATLAAGSAEAALPVTQLQNDIGAAATAWQTLSGVVTAAGGAWVTITPASRQTWRAFIAARTNLTAAGTMTVTLYDSPSTVVWTGTSGSPVPGYGQMVLIADQDHAADYCRIEFNDAANPDDFLNIPLIFAGPAWIPTIGMSWNSAIGRDSQIDETRSRGGQEFPIARWQQRRWEIELPQFEDAELWDDAQELDRVSRYGGNVLAVPNIGSATIGNEAVYGRVESAGDVTFVTGVAGLHGWRFRIRERL